MPDDKTSQTVVKFNPFLLLFIYKKYIALTRPLQIITITIIDTDRNDNSYF